MQSSSTSNKRPWRKWRYRTFILVNVIGIVIAIPLLSSVFPLVRIWWTTRSQESFIKHERSTRAAHPPAVAVASSESNDAISDAPHTPENAWQGLTNQLGVVAKLSDTELQTIVASQFGAKKRSAQTSTFDRDSAVFHSIARKMATLQGKQYYCYEIDLVDENGNHKTHVDYYEKPDMDYERSMATLNLVNGNPQLKKIYDAFAHVLAEKSSGSNSTVTVEGPAVRLEKTVSRAQR
jgi:hypothetical protein